MVFYKHANNINHIYLFPALILGSFLPILAPIILIFIGKIKENNKIKTIGYMLLQAATLGSIISSIYKAFTGRIQPTLSNGIIDISRDFNFGFLKHGIFWGWPSSHTTIAFAMSISLITLYPKNNKIKIVALIYAFYIAFSVSLKIHWFSEAVAGAIIGSVIGKVVGKSFIINKN